ncbi:MAG: hypothetical protein AAB434_03460 [Planctomycetota bacterium]
MPEGTESAPTMPTPPPPPPAQREYCFGIDPGMARKILAAGVILFLLVAFVENGARKKLGVKQSEMMSLRAQLDAPVPPVEPDAPKDDDYKDKKDALDAAKKAYDEHKKDYDEALKEYKNDYVEWLEKAYDRKVKRADLERDLAEMEAEMGDWGYFKYFLRFVASLAIILGLAHTLFHGSDIERAAAIFLLGTLAVNLL